MKKHIFSLFFIFFAIILTGCRNYYNDTIEWMDNIEIDTNIEILKENQPEFVEIDWRDPEIKGNENWYYIINIRGSYDPLGMSHQLVFIENKYNRRESHK